MKAHVIENGIVVNTIEVESLDFMPGLIESDDSEVGIGWHYDGTNFTPPEPAPEPIPTSCTPAQGLIALFALKQITEQNILDAIGQIPDDVQRYTATIGYQRATTWERESATMQAMAGLLSLSEEDLDALFVYAVQVQV